MREAAPKNLATGAAVPSTRITTTCTDCGEILLEPSQLTLLVQPEGIRSYVFTCPGCDQAIQRPADQRTVAVLARVGVPLHGDGRLRPSLPEGYTAPPFTLDDLLDFHLRLRDLECLTAPLIDGEVRARH